MKNKLGIILLCIIYLTCCYVSVFGDGLLQQIYVDLKPINVVIDGENKNPPSDMQPMIYNDRTYVPLRYVAESLGKDVDWDGDTRTVYIGEHQPLQTEIFESFTEPVSKNWEVTGNFQADGPNGYCLNGNRKNPTKINLINFPKKQCDFTLSFEFLMHEPSWDVGDFLTIVFNKDEDGNNYKSIGLNPSANTVNCVENRQICSYNFEDSVYHILKAKVVNGRCELYIDNNYIHTFDLSSNGKPTLLIEGREKTLIRNITVKIND